MELSQRHHPSLWTALIWKDFQQVKQVFFAVLVGVFCVQFMLLILGALSREADNKSALFGGTVTIACAAPILLALGCSGMLVGQERQSGTWAWSSSLPVSWSQALGSKLLVTLFGSLAASLPLAVIPIGLLLARRLETQANSVAAVYVSWLTLVIFLEVVLFCFLTTVLIRETLTALVVAGIGLTVVHFSMGALVADAPSLDGISDMSQYRFAIFASAILLTGFLLMTVAFRWRWGIGQQATFAFQGNSVAVERPISAYSQNAIGVAPSEWWMMLRHSFANSFWLRLFVLSGAFFISPELGYQTMGLFPVGLLLILGILGVTAFEGDQVLTRYRFLADRGVAPWKLVVCRLVVVSMLALVVCVVCALSVSRFHQGSLFPWSSLASLGPVVLLIGSFSSIVFRKSIIAVTVAFVIVLVSWAVILFLLAWIHSQVEWLVEGQTSLRNVVLGFFPVSAIAILVATFVLSRRWLVFDDAKLAPHFLWISVAALFSPVLLACTFGFLFVPNIPWQEMSVEIRTSRPVRSQLLSFSHPLLDDSIDVDHRSLRRDVSSEINGLRQSPDQHIVHLIEPMLTSLEAELKTGNRPAGAELQYKHYAKSLEFMIARTAALARVCLDEKDPKSALRFWRANRELQQLSYEFDPLLMRASRNAALLLLNELNDDEVAALGGREVFKNLIPAAHDECTASIRHSWLVANINRNYLRSTFVGLFPPLRWRLERQLAWSVAQHRRTLETKPETYQNYLCREMLINRYPD